MRSFFPLITLITALGCTETQPLPEPINSETGRNCLVYFRRDALGMASNIPSSALTGNLNGAELVLTGELMQAGENWIAINQHGRVFHIPRASILMLEFGIHLPPGQRLSAPASPSATGQDNESH